MNYAELKTNIEDICENSFTDEQLAMFTQQAEQKIYNTVQIPALRKNVTANLVAGYKYLALPSDYLYTYSLAVENAAGDYVFLLDKDVNFIREAYPNASIPPVSQPTTPTSMTTRLSWGLPPTQRILRNCITGTIHSLSWRLVLRGWVKSLTPHSSTVRL
jgi:hypothetical protein